MQGHVGSHKQAGEKAQIAPGGLLSTTAIGKTRERLLDNATIGKPRVDLSKGYEETKRNMACTRVAGSLLGKGYSEEETLAKCLEWNELNGPPMSEQEVRGVVHSIAKAEKRKKEKQYQETRPTEHDDEVDEDIKFAGEIPLTSSKMLIKNLLPADGMGFLAGQSRAGKTGMAVKLALSLTTKIPFFGYEVKEQVGVVYVTGEGAGGINKRITAAMLYEKIKRPIPINYIKKIPNLQSEPGIKAFIAMLRRRDRIMRQRFGMRLGLVILDTVAACFNMQDENSNAEANTICRTMQHISEEAGVFVLAVHHYGKDANTGLRGASAWHGAAEMILSLTADINVKTGDVRDRKLSLAKARDDVEGPIAPFTLEFVKMTTDEGEEETSYIIKVDTQPRLPRTEDKRDKCQKTFIEAGQNASREHEDFQQQGSTRRKAVELKYVREQFQTLYVTGVTDPAKKNHVLQNAWRRALNKLPEGWQTRKDRDGDEWLLL
jgi:hypothetical protein